MAVRLIRTPDGPELVSDASFLSFVTEELIALGAVRIALPWTHAPDIAHLPRSISRRLSIVDKRARAVQLAHWFLYPVAHAINLAIYDGVAVWSPATDDERAVNGYHEVWNAVVTWQLGHRNELQVEIPTARVNAAIAYLRKKCATRREAAIRLAVLASIFASYRTASIHSLVTASSNSREAVDAFNELFDDATYRELAGYAQGLGWPDKFEWAKRRIERAARSIARRRYLRGILSIGRRIISTSTRFDLPDDKSLAPLFDGGYSPPLVRLAPALRRARRTWARVNPPFQPLVADDSPADLPVEDAHEDVFKKFGPELKHYGWAKRPTFR
ncbi:MAG: hypothetical protein ACRDL7_00365 [Gaiellaceae bacterium]